jgi:hypothetical protein
MKPLRANIEIWSSSLLTYFFIALLLYCFIALLLYCFIALLLSLIRGACVYVLFASQKIKINYKL